MHSICVHQLPHSSAEMDWLAEVALFHAPPSLKEVASQCIRVWPDAAWHAVRLVSVETFMRSAWWNSHATDPSNIARLREYYMDNSENETLTVARCLFALGNPKVIAARTIQRAWRRLVRACEALDALVAGHPSMQAHLHVLETHVLPKLIAVSA